MRAGSAQEKAHQSVWLDEDEHYAAMLSLRLARTGSESASFAHQQEEPGRIEQGLAMAGRSHYTLQAAFLVTLQIRRGRWGMLCAVCRLDYPCLAQSIIRHSAISIISEFDETYCILLSKKQCVPLSSLVVSLPVNRNLPSNRMSQIALCIGIDISQAS